MDQGWDGIRKALVKLGEHGNDLARIATALEKIEAKLPTYRNPIMITGNDGLQLLVYGPAVDEEPRDAD